MSPERLSDEQVVAQYKARGPGMQGLVRQLLTEFSNAKFAPIEVPEGETFANTIDAASANEAADVAAGISELRSNREGAVRRMLEHIRAGTYGQCTRCMGAIPLLRLQAIPEAELCMPCKSKSE